MIFIEKIFLLVLKHVFISFKGYKCEAGDVIVRKYFRVIEEKYFNIRRYCIWDFTAFVQRNTKF